jgi:hypothetical protein
MPAASARKELPAVAVLTDTLRLVRVGDQPAASCASSRRQAINDPQSVARGHVPAAWRVPSHQCRLADIPPQNRSDCTVSGEALTPAPFPSEVPTPGRWIRSDRGTGRWLRPRKILDWSTLATQRGGWAIQPLIHTGQHNGWYTRGTMHELQGFRPFPTPDRPPPCH